MQRPVPNIHRINIRRDRVLEDSYQGIMNVKDVEVLKSRIWIDFEGEKGYDYGGLSRFVKLSRVFLKDCFVV